MRAPRFLLVGIALLIISVSALAQHAAIVGEYINPLNLDDCLEINGDGSCYMEILGLNVGVTGRWKIEGERLSLIFPDGTTFRGTVKTEAILLEGFGMLPLVWIKSTKHPPSLADVVGKYVKDKQPDEVLFLNWDGTYTKTERVFGSGLLTSSGKWELDGHAVRLFHLGDRSVGVSAAVLENRLYFTGLFGTDVWIKEPREEPRSAAPVGYITGRVMDATTGRGLANARVEVIGAPPSSTTTSTSGEYTLTLAPGTHDLTASATDYQSQTKANVTVIAGQTTTVNFQLVPLASKNHPPLARAKDIASQPKIMYSDTAYTVTAKYFDPDGRTDLKYCYLRLRHPTKSLTMMWNQTDGQFAPWAGEEGTNYLTIIDVQAVPITEGGLEGYLLSWTFKLNAQWPEAENTIDFGVFAMDKSNRTSDCDWDASSASFKRFEKGTGNRPPIAIFRHYPSDMAWLFQSVFLLLGYFPYYDCGQEITFDATWSVDPDGSIVSYRWEFGDGSTALGKIVAYKYSARGIYRVRLIVTDNEGETNTYTEQLFIAIPTQNQLDRLRDSVDHLLTNAVNILDDDVARGSEALAEAAQEFLSMIGEDAFDALYDLVTAVLPSHELGSAKSEIWKLLMREVGMTGGEHLGKSVFSNLMKAIKRSGAAYGGVLSKIRSVVREAKEKIYAGRSGALDKIEHLEVSAVRTFQKDFDLRIIGNLFMGQYYSVAAETFKACADIARQDRDSWSLKVGKFLWNTGFAAGTAAIEAWLGPIIGASVGLAELTSGVKEAIESASENQRYWLLSHYLLRLGGTEDSTRFPMNVPAAIQENVLKGLQYLRNGLLPRTMEGEIVSVEEIGKNILRLQIKNTGANAGWFRIVVYTQTCFTSYELFQGAGRYYIVPYVAIYPNGTLGWYLAPKQVITAEIELPKLTSSAYLNLLGENESGIYGLDTRAMVLTDERSWTGRVKSWFKVRWGSPIEVTVQDGEGRITGISEGMVRHGIPNSYYDGEKSAIWVVSSMLDDAHFDKFSVLVTGTEEGTYELEIERGGIIGRNTFSAHAMPVSARTQHRYTIDWNALSRGKNGVKIEIDRDGDGVFDRAVKAGSEVRSVELRQAVHLWVWVVVGVVVTAASVAIGCLLLKMLHSYR